MKLSLLLMLSALSVTYGYRILAIQHAPSKSHHNLMMGLVNPLLEAGHEVTMVSIYPQKKPIKNLKLIDMSVLQQTTANANVFNTSHMSFSKFKMEVSNWTRTIVQTPEVREMLIKERFDAVMTEWFMTNAESGYAAALQVPWIALIGSAISPPVEDLVDTVHSIPTIPTMMNIAPIPMNLWQRLKNTMWYCLMTFGSLMDYSAEEARYKELFEDIAKARGVTLPPFSEAMRNISVLFTNTHPSFESAQSLPPNVVEIAGYHIDDDIPPLPKDLQELLDNSTNGVVYFSMGSVVKSKMMPEKTKQDLVKMFGELPYTVLWKFEAKMENLPKNLHIRDWMPQPSILTHPNVKVFMTHGGALSTIEALRFGVPLLAIPVFADQPSNSQKAVTAGRALKVPYSPDMVPDLRVALNEILRNDSYYKRAKSLSSIFNKRPVSAKKQVQNYVELAIESGGAYHLRSKALLYKWYQIWMLDQVAVLVAVLAVLYLSVKKLVSAVTGKLAKKKVKKN